MDIEGQPSETPDFISQLLCADHPGCDEIRAMEETDIKDPPACF